jgi:hypothetical protein
VCHRDPVDYIEFFLEPEVGGRKTARGYYGGASPQVFFSFFFFGFFFATFGSIRRRKKNYPF